MEGLNKKGMRHVLLPGQAFRDMIFNKPGRPVIDNLPADVVIIGTVAMPSRPGTVVLLCGSDEWEGVADTDKTSPTYGEMLTHELSFKEDCDGPAQVRRSA